MPQIPPAMNLGNPTNAIPSIWKREPVEGRQSVNQTVDWSKAIAKGLSAVSMNLQNGGTVKFSQICGLIIDNSNCGADLDFIFPDTNVVLSIPAYAPYTVVPVETRQTQFFVAAIGVLVAGDITQFTALNFTPDPIAVPNTRQQLSVTAGSILVDGVTTTQLVPLTVSGTLEGISATVACPVPLAVFNDRVSLRDNLNVEFWTSNVASPNATTGFTQLIASMNDMSLRFTGGLKLIQAGGVNGGANLSINLYYRVP